MMQQMVQIGGDEWIKSNDGNWERKKEIECETKR